MLTREEDLRARAVVALMAYGGLRRSAVVALDVGDYDAQFVLRRVLGKGGHEVSAPLPAGTLGW
jgi:site-specific recombinase XerC